MGALIDFIFDNWFFLVVLYFIKKLNDARKAAREQAPEGDRRIEPDPLPFPMGDSGPLEREVLQREPLRAEEGAGYEGYNLSQPSSVLAAPRNLPGQAKPEQEKMDAVDLNASRAVEGMMWAEIFAKPRALRPHSPKRKY
jgi:hypothetical protein